METMDSFVPNAFFVSMVNMIMYFIDIFSRVILPNYWLCYVRCHIEMGRTCFLAFQDAKDR